ncbi:MAG: ABC transporter substrate-binding protein [Arenicellales bacterium WSBS_2016_MAG_OTU3]
MKFFQLGCALQSYKNTLRTLAVVLLTLGVGIANAETTIRVLNWQGYGTDEAWSLQMFEQNTGIKVVHENFNSEQEMLTKLRTNPGAYDVVLINSAFTSQAAREGLIQPIDTSGMKNTGDLLPGMGDNKNFVIDGKVYAVAWVWGLTSFAVNTDKFSTVPESIEVLWDAKNAGRVGWRDDAVESVQLAAIALGQDMNNPSDYDAIKAKLRALKPQIRTFWSSENEWNQFLSAGEFDLATYWSGSASRSKTQFNLPVSFVIPKEGAIGWLDGLSIAKDAPHPEEAKKFIDWMIEPEFYVKWDTDVGAPASANAKANAGLPDTAFNRSVLGDKDKVAKVQFMNPIDDDVRKKMLELWQETKTYMQE